MFENKLEIYEADHVTIDDILKCLEKNNWINEYEKPVIDGSNIIFTNGDSDEIRVVLMGDYIIVEGDSSHDVVVLWSELKTMVALLDAIN